MIDVYIFELIYYTLWEKEDLSQRLMMSVVRMTLVQIIILLGKVMLLEMAVIN